MYHPGNTVGGDTSAIASNTSVAASNDFPRPHTPRLLRSPYCRRQLQPGTDSEIDSTDHEIALMLTSQQKKQYYNDWINSRSHLSLEAYVADRERDKHADEWDNSTTATCEESRDQVSTSVHLEQVSKSNCQTIETRCLLTLVRE